MARGPSRTVVPGLLAVLRVDGTERYAYASDRTGTDGKRDQRQMTLEGVISTPETRDADDLRAIEVWGALRTKSRNGEQPVPKGNIRLNDVAEEVWAKVQHKVERGERSPRYLDTLKRDYRNHVVPFLGNPFFKNLSHREVVELLNERRSKPGRREGEKAASFSANNVLTVMSLLSRHAYEQEYMPVNICDRIPRDERPRQRASDRYLDEAKPLRDEELTSLLGYMREHEEWYVGIATLMAYTGMRRAEAAGVRWCDWDQEKGRIVLRHQLQTLKPGEAPTFGKRKEDRNGAAKRRYRSIPVFPPLREELQRQRQRELGKGNAPKPETFCFSAMEEIGRPIEGATITRAIKRSAKRAGLDKHVTPQVLRATTATIFAHAGIERAVASDILGHTIEVDDEHYVRAYRDEREQVEVERLLAQKGVFGLVEDA